MPIIELVPTRTKDGFEIPKFGKACVCCGADPLGREQSFDASTEDMRVTPIAVPVCWACRDHALLLPGAPIGWTIMVLLGVLAVIASTAYLLSRPEDTFLWTLLAIGAVVASAGTVKLVQMIRFERRERRRPGHAPWLVFAVRSGKSRVITANDKLADEMLLLNPGARRSPTRGELDAGGLPRARLVSGGAPAVDPDEHASAIAQRIVAGKPADLDYLRVELARGSVPHALVEQLLAETETALGRRDLVARYRKLRAEVQTS